MEGKPDWLPGFLVQIYCNRSESNVQRKRRGLILADTESKFLASSQRPYNTHSYATHKNRFDVQTDVTGT